jgi:hypothetical protein
LRIHRQVARERRVALVLSALAVAAVMLLPGPALADSGGTSVSGSDDGSGCHRDARLRHGKAIAASCAPSRVKAVIDAANEIRKKPYKWGGGHGSWKDSGYDCSGAVSYALHAGRFLKSPLDSSGLAKWGKRGKGSWITVYGAPSHAYMVVAGLRFDTAMVRGDGPSWSKRLRSTPENYKKRHKGSY